MEAREISQHRNNDSERCSCMVVGAAEALWRLRIAASAAEMVRSLPAGAVHEDGTVDLAEVIDPS